jgi:hypothetical protein
MLRQLQVSKQGENIVIHPKEVLSKPEYRIQLCQACPFIKLCSRKLAGNKPTATMTLSRLRTLFMDLEPNRSFESINLTQTIGDMANCTKPLEEQRRISMDVASQSWKSYID